VTRAPARRRSPRSASRSAATVLLKWLGERGADAPVKTAVAVSVPFLLGEAADRMERGWSRLYQTPPRRPAARELRAQVPAHTLAAVVDVRRLRTFRQFDDQVTAPLHGSPASTTTTAGRAAGSSSRRIRVPTLIVHARDDPFMWPRTVPSRGELSEIRPARGDGARGHVGFVGGALAVAAAMVAGWQDRRAPRRASVNGSASLKPSTTLTPERYLGGTKPTRWSAILCGMRRPRRRFRSSHHPPPIAAWRPLPPTTRSTMERPLARLLHPTGWISRSSRRPPRRGR